MAISSTMLMVFGVWHLFVSGVLAHMIYKAVKVLNERKWLMDKGTVILFLALVFAIIMCVLSATVGINYLDGRMIL